MSFPVGGGGGRRRGLTVLHAVQPLPDPVLGYADVRHHVVLAQPQPQPSRRVVGILPELPLNARITWSSSP
ncbi:hypothetical protein ACVNF4_01910 [Streptomyces sp. S6]